MYSYIKIHNLYISINFSARDLLNLFSLLSRKRKLHLLILSSFRPTSGFSALKGNWFMFRVIGDGAGNPVRDILYLT